MSKTIVAMGSSKIRVPHDFPGKRYWPDIEPEVGKVYDFTQAEFAWVCGKPYNTVCNGMSNGINVAGKKIKIISVSPATPHFFGVIKFQEIE